MGLLLVFAAGYVMGARAGGESLDDVIDAVHAIRESDEELDSIDKIARSGASNGCVASTFQHCRQPAERISGVCAQCGHQVVELVGFPDCVYRIDHIVE